MILGQILQQAGLVSSAQIEVALINQSIYHELRIGEILVLHGWLKQETADFFAEKWQDIIKEKKRKPLGQYLKDAGLVNEEQIQEILQEQKRTFLRFGGVAILKGYLKPNTLDFFLEHLFPQQREHSASTCDWEHPSCTEKIRSRKNKPTNMKKLHPNDLARYVTADNFSRELVYQLEEELAQQLEEELAQQLEEEIIWIS